MSRIVALLIGITITGIVLASMILPAQASPSLQLTAFPTPTPGPDGRILYTVQADDTLWRISAVTGVSLDELRRLNNLDVEAVIRPGQVLLLGLGSPFQATPEPGATQAVPQQPLVTPSPTPLMDTSSICALLYLDVNGNAIREENEITLADGEVSVTERLGAYSDKKTTTFQDEPVCFDQIPPGEYIITMALPGGMNRTTNLSVSVVLVPGDTSFINFGAQPAGAFPTIVASGSESDTGGSVPLIAILGIFLLVGGAGLGLWAAFSSRRRFSADQD
ncbi:MAG: LysM peptidoglycan-binding domain-containing protein [Anaerolineales bacterium]|jgi:LysM repeat protein